MQRKFLLFGILIVLVGAGYGIFYAINFYSTRASLQAYNDYNNIFKNDTYGGATPEETLQLFIAALKANDIDQATLYFMPDDKGSREKWRNFLLRNTDNFSSIISALTHPILLSENLTGTWFKVDDGARSGRILLVNNGGVWKIESL